MTCTYSVEMFRIKTFLETRPKPAKRERVHASYTLGAGRLRVFARVILPHSYPGSLDVARIDLAAAWRMLVVAELLAAQEGLAFRLVRALRGRQVDTMFAVLIVVGLIPPVDAFARFARAGGTPMPAAPTTHLVVKGFNRYVRNPMYAGLLVVIVGQALLFARWELLLYAAFFWAVTAAFVRWYEEPTLVRQYGSEYEAYRRAVPAWIPRVRPQ